MYCPKCGRKYIVDAFETNPVCDDDGTGLDFEPSKKYKGKGEKNEKKKVFPDLSRS